MTHLEYTELLAYIAQHHAWGVRSAWVKYIVPSFDFRTSRYYGVILRGMFDDIELFAVNENYGRNLKQWIIEMLDALVAKRNDLEERREPLVLVSEALHNVFRELLFPRTLGSALYTIEQGFDLPDTDMPAVQRELKALIAKHGENTNVRELLNG